MIVDLCLPCGPTFNLALPLRIFNRSGEFLRKKRFLRKKSVKKMVPELQK